MSNQTHNRPDTIVTKHAFTVARRCHGRRTVVPRDPPPSPPVGRLPRVTKLLALAIHFDELIHTGAVTSQAELARLGQVSRPRLTQIMNLLHLSPDIQDQILHHPKITTGRDPLTERELRVVALLPSWKKQSTQFNRLTTHL